MIPKKHYFYSIFILILSLNEVYSDEKSSLTFVIDDTDSMGDEIQQVKDGVKSIFNTVLNSKQSQIEDFVLVTFNDPDPLDNPLKYSYPFPHPSTYKLRNITDNQRVFENALEDIKVNYGGDCEEYALSGIMMGIEKSRPRSTIYVFTDASAKDYSKYEEVKNLAIKKQSKVIFVLTGFCGESKKGDDYTVYHRLAHATSGYIFEVDKSDIHKIIAEIVINIQGRRTEISNEMFLTGHGSFQFNIDGKNKEPTVTVTGVKPTLEVTGPDGWPAITETAVRTRNVLIKKIIDPMPGVHTAIVDSSSETRVKITARTEVMFVHGFSTVKATSIKDTTTRPLPDIKSYIYIKMTDGILNLQTLAIIDNKDGKKLKDVPLVVMNKNDMLYVTELVDLPTFQFKLAISGNDPDTNEYITRVGPPIEPQPIPVVIIKHKAPEVSIPEGPYVTIDYNGEISLTCKVSAYPEPTIVWTSANGTVLNSKSSILELPYDYISYMKISQVKNPGTFYCTASNDEAKNKFSQIYVNPRSPFKVISAPKETTSVLYEAPTNIVCNIQSSMPMRIKWFYQKKEKPSVVVEIYESDSYIISSDKKTLHIKTTVLELVGKYTCEASLLSDINKKISYSTKVEISNLKSPEITVSDHSITVMNGQSMSATCKANGVPKPIVTWQFKPKNTNVYASVPAIGEQLSYSNIGYERAGLYVCTATNAIDAQNRAINVVVHGQPRILNIDSVYNAVTGDTVLKIPCVVTGVPEPTIVWKHQGKVVTLDSKITIDNNALVIKNPVEKDSNNFTCEATNKYGNATKNFEAYISDFVDIDEKFNSYIYLVPGESKGLKCHLPHSDPQSVRWYVNFDKLYVRGSVFSLQNANFSNDGNYTCRVNTNQGSKSLNYVVDVGYKPIFITPQSPIVNWNGNREATIDCIAKAKPKENVEWFHNGKQLDNKLSELHITGWGNFTCNVSNVHGSVQHTFNVTNEGCVIDRTLSLLQNTPLLIGATPSTWPKLTNDNELALRRSETITLACSTQDQPTNTFKTHPNAKTIIAECFMEDQFIVEGKKYKFKDFQCTKNVEPSVVNTHKECMKDGELLEVGFKLINGFLNVYDICYSKADHRTLYSKVLISGISIGNTTGDDIVKCRYNQRQLVSPKDVLFGLAATMSNEYNEIPVFEPCNTSARKSWSYVEDIFQSAIYITDSSFNVWTGASHYNKNETPRYLWKVAKFDDTFEIIVYVNAQNPDKADILCSNHTLEIITFTSSDPFTYTCSMDEFSRAFAIPKKYFDV